MVKADGYGHGLLPGARAAVPAARPGSASPSSPRRCALRAAGRRGPVLSWLHVPGSDFAGARSPPTSTSSVSAPWALDEIAAAARAAGRTARVHLKVDTGLGRDGAVRRRLARPASPRARRLRGRGRRRASSGIWSHFAYADEPDHPTVRPQQAAVFDEAVAQAERRRAARPRCGTWPTRPPR